MAFSYRAPTEAPADAQRLAPASRRAAFAALAAFILLGPAPGQLFGAHTVLLREWQMFSGAGVGLLKGHFTLHRADGAVTLSPLEVAALPSHLALPIERRVYEPSDLKAFAARICNDARETARLSFEGSVGTFSGWRALAVHDVCRDPAPARPADARP
jgi:hypothetical protein